MRDWSLTGDSPELQLWRELLKPRLSLESPDPTLSSAPGYGIVWQVAKSVFLILWAGINRRQSAERLQSSQLWLYWDRTSPRHQSRSSQISTQEIRSNCSEGPERNETASLTSWSAERETKLTLGCPSAGEMGSHSQEFQQILLWN